MLDEELNRFRDRGTASGQGLGALIQVLAFILRPKAMLIGLVVLLFIGIASSARDPILLPLSFALMGGGFLLWLVAR